MLERSGSDVWLLAPAAAACALCLAHSLRTRGRAATARIFGVCAAFVMAKGAIDVPRLVDEMPYRMNLSIFPVGRYNLGVFLVLWPLIRLISLYLGLVGAELLLARTSRRDRFWSLNGLALFLYCMAGEAVEHANLALGWWTWQPWMKIGTEVPASLHFFFTWIEVAVGCYPSILICFLVSDAPEKRVRKAFVHLAAYYVFLIFISAIAPMLRNPILIPVALLLMLVGLFPVGPRVDLRELRPRASAPRTRAAPAVAPVLDT